MLPKDQVKFVHKINLLTWVIAKFIYLSKQNWRCSPCRPFVQSIACSDRQFYQLPDLSETIKRHLQSVGSGSSKLERFETRTVRIINGFPSTNKSSAYRIGELSTADQEICHWSTPGREATELLWRERNGKFASETVGQMAGMIEICIS